MFEGRFKNSSSRRKRSTGMSELPTSARSNAASLKKFYACMLAAGEMSESAFAELRAEIKEDLKEWVEEAESRARYEDWK